MAVLGLGLVTLFLWNANLHDVWREVTRARIELLALAVGVTGLTYLLRAIRWQFLLRPIGHVGLANAFRTTVIGFAASTVLPARAGEVLRPWLLARKEGLSATSAFATVILERVLDTVTVLVLFAVFLLVADPQATSGDPAALSRLKIGGAGAAAVSVAILVVMFVLAGHPGTLSRIEAVFHACCRCASLPWRKGSHARSPMGLHRAATGAACGCVAAVACRSGCRSQEGSSW